MRALNPWRPFRELTSLRRDIDDLFGRFFGDWERDLPTWLQPSGWYPQVESYVDGKNLIVKTDLPGIDPKDVEISVVGNQLTIKGERRAAQEKKDEDYLYREVQYGQFERTLPLPEGVEADNVSARYHDGILEISMPAPKELAAKKIPIQIR